MSMTMRYSVEVMEFFGEMVENVEFVETIIRMRFQEDMKLQEPMETK